MRRFHKSGSGNVGCFVLLLVYLIPVIVGIIYGTAYSNNTRALPEYSVSSSSRSSGRTRTHIDDGKIYITDTGECYHRSWCSSLDYSKYEIDLDDAIDKGYRPCGRCNPPSK